MHLAGVLVLYNNMLQSLYTSQIVTMGFATLFLMGTFVILFRSLRIAIIAIFPNLLAVSCVLGVMGWLGIPLDMMTITIAAIGVGLAFLVTRAMSGLLFGFTHNLNWFRQGGPRGMLAVMGPMHPQKFRALQRSLMFMARGVQNAWRMVVANPQGEGADVKWVPFGVSNKEMEFAEWINACFRLMCSLWQIDATEVGFYYASEGNRGAMFESSPEAKLKAGKDKGLRPLATAISSWINKFIVHRLNPDLELEFLGLGAMTEKERAELSKTLVESSRTVDEVRALDNMGKDPNGLGNLILNPQYITAYNAQQAQKQQAAMMAQQGQGGPGGPEGADGPGGAGQPGAEAQGEGAGAPGGDDWANDPLPDGGDVSGGFADEQAGEAAKSLVRAYSWVL